MKELLSPRVFVCILLFCLGAVACLAAQEADAQTTVAGQGASEPEKAEEPRREKEEGEGEQAGWTSDIDVGGNVRLFLFEVAEDIPGRNDFEQGALRLTFEQELLPADENKGLAGIHIEAHGVLSGVSPDTSGGGVGGGTGVTSGTTGHRRFDLTTDVLRSELEDDDVRLWAEIDRLNVRFEHRAFSLTVGRQPITWGVNYFWPVLDLFGPFSPAAVDRDYKPGVDAARLRIPVGDFSEVEVIAAAQGEDTNISGASGEDWSYGALGRFNLGGSDFGFMAGEFFHDTRLGMFGTGDAAGFGLRGEVLYTEVAEEQLGLPGESRSEFWRATVGVDRLLSPRSSLVIELSFNGYGGEQPSDYGAIAASNRSRRGEITSLGREYSGLSLSFQISPLLTFGGALLTNWGDGSTLLQPSLSWSLSDNSSATFGAYVGFGDGISEQGRPLSEYGVVPVTVWGGIRSYF